MAHSTSEGLLLVIKASDCHACHHLTDNGFFEDLMTTLDIGDVVQLELKDMSGFGEDEPNHEIYNIENGYPSFKYMMMDTYDNLESFSTQEALAKMCFFNGKIVNGQFVKTDEHRSLTISTMQEFCNASAERLSTRSKPKSVKTSGPVPRYPRK